MQQRALALLREVQIRRAVRQFRQPRFQLRLAQAIPCANREAVAEQLRGVGGNVSLAELERLPRAAHRSRERRRQDARGHANRSIAVRVEPLGFDAEERVRAQPLIEAEIRRVEL